MNKIIINKSKLDPNHTFDQYNKLIDELRNITRQLSPTSTVYICFEKDINYIMNPAFLILLFNFYEQLKLQNIKMLIDITNILDEAQHAFLIHLQQFIDYKFIKVEYRFDPFTKEPYITDLQNHKFISLRKYDQILIYYATKTEHNQTQLKLDSDYKHLPIVKLTNNKLIDEDYENDKYGNRKEFYNKLQFDKEEKKLWLPLTVQEEYKKKEEMENIWNIVFDKYLKINQHNDETLKALKNILYETVYNIRKHTFFSEVIANGYISFFKKEKTFEFLIYDDYKDGFLNKYLETMIEERNNEKSAEALLEYDSIINDLTKGKNVEVLENIFNLENIFSIQKKRIIKHFGIPLLLKILVEINKNENNEKANLSIYVHRNEECYRIEFLDGKTSVSQINDTFMKGTFIHISLPSKSEINRNTFENKVLDIQTSYFKEKFRHSETIKPQCDNFKIVDFIELKDKSVKFNNSNKISIIVKYKNNYNVSDFLRTIYVTAYLFETFIKDIVVFSFPIKSNINYLEIYRDTASLKHISNILFLDNFYPRAIFIGGKSDKQMCLVNNVLSVSYNHEKINFVKKFCNDLSDAKIEIDSNLFYMYKGKDYFIPIDIFHGISKENTELLYTDMINNNLDEKYNKPYHVDIGDGYHINSFYLLKQIFEDSTWISRIAFNLAQKLNKNTVLIGVENYSTLIINKALEIFGENIESFVIYDFTITEQFDKFISAVAPENIILFCPVITNAKSIDNFLKKIDSCKKYCAIKLEYVLNKENKSFEPFFTKNIDNIIHDAYNCPKCFAELSPDNDDYPLYTFDNDGFTLKNVYTDSIVQNYSMFKNLETKLTWKNSIYFGHVQRSTNHYLYYTKTLIFMKENKEDIENSFGEIKLDIKSDEIPVILAPLDKTNNEFISIIDRVVFNNNAIIHYFNLSNKEQNYNIVESIKSKYINSNQYKFYFVDDEISSGNTLEYFVTLLNNITSNHIKFSAVFAMINRIDKFGALILNNYCNEYNFYIYKNLNIKPIKTNFENCYLCERKKELNDLAKKSSLIFIKSQYRNKAEDLNINISTDIETVVDNKKLIEFKNYLKMTSTEFINNNIEKFDKIDEKSYFKIGEYLNDFKKQVKNNFYQMYFTNKIDDSNLDIAIMNILNFEADIAFVKALYFPKLSYYHKVRVLTHKYIYDKLKKKRNEYFDIKTKNITIKPILTSIDLRTLKSYIQLSDFYEYYNNDEKTNIDKFNFFIIASSYMNMNYILEEEMIEFYYNLAKKVKKDDLDIKLLHKYPVAIKTLISYSIEKAKYFQNQFDLFQDREDKDEKKLYKLKYEKDFSLIFPLYIENSLLIEDSLVIENVIIDDFNKSIDNLLSSILKYIDDLNIDKSNIKFYIDTNPMENKETLVDIFNQYEPLNNELQEYEYILYKGAVSDTTNDTKYIKLKLNDKIENEHNLWCNYYDELNNKTIIRITETLNSELTFDPIGVIVFTHDDSLETHLDLARKILKVQDQISKYIKDYILPGVIADKENKVLGNYLRKYNHNVGEMIDLKELLQQKLIDNTIFEDFDKEVYQKTELLAINDNIQNFITYAFGLPYIAKAAQLGFKENTASNTNKFNFFDRVNKLKKKIIEFLEIAPKISSKTNLQNSNIKYNIIVSEVTQQTEFTKVLSEDLDGIIFEFCYNAAKYNNLKNGDTCNIEFYTENEFIVIENNLNYKKVNSKSKVGLLSIEKYFNSIGYNMTTEPEDNKFLIKIKKDV